MQINESIHMNTVLCKMSKDQVSSVLVTLLVPSIKFALQLFFQFLFGCQGHITMVHDFHVAQPGLQFDRSSQACNERTEMKDECWPDKALIKSIITLHTHLPSALTKPPRPKTPRGKKKKKRRLACHRFREHYHNPF